MKILVIGSGGREHAIITALSKSKRLTEIHAAPGNGGIAELATCHDVKATDIPGMVKLAQEINADWVFVAPDDPLVLGMVDSLNENGFATFGPRKNAAILEGSKHFSKDFMKRHAIPTADYESFTDSATANAYIKAKDSYPCVIKCDGLALGKGVIIAEDETAAFTAVKDILDGGKFGGAGGRIVIEEYLEGVEVTVLAFTDGKTVVPFPASTDHKRALDGDKGLNTGGMGVVAPVPYYTAEIADECMEKIFLPTIKGMAEEGRAFKGCIYFGLMISPTFPDKCSAKVIEYNCRFGDPETQALLPLLETDLLDIIESVWEEKLDTLDINFSNLKSACVVMASGGYPEKYSTGFTISGIEATANPQDGVHVFHAGTRIQNSELVTAGGRVLNVVGIGETLENALEKAYSAVKSITFEGAHYRTDIGKKAIT
ncbi:MAG: phosphoribosylamine--glycine ligase [Oscillospiraceae bacterium]|nr:phosphoribosylamine--glycine ligase [Oscillospiraceae bacterium]